MAEAKVLAMALYELRILLSAEVTPNASHELRLAERLAYALHNDAMAVIEGKPFDHETTLARVANIDRLIGGNDGERIAKQMRSAMSN